MNKRTGRFTSFSVEGPAVGVKASHLAVSHPPAEAKWNDHVAGLCIAGSHYHLV